MNKFRKIALLCIISTALVASASALTACGGSYIDKISVKGKSSYMVGDEFGGATLSVTYGNGKREQIEVTSDMLVGFDTSVAGNKTVVISYGGKVIGLDISVSDMYVSSIEIASDSKTEYLIGAEYLNGDASIIVTYTDGSIQDVDVTADMLTGFDTETEGDKNLIVKYGMLDTAYSVNVRYPYVTAMSIASGSKDVYRVGDEFDKIVLDVTYEDGVGETVTIDDLSGIEGFDTSVVCEQTLRVTYRNRTIGFDIRVLQAIASVTVKSHTELYGVGDEFESATLSVLYADDTSDTVAVTSEMLTGFDTDSVGNKTVTVEYEGKTASFDISVYGRLVDSGEINKIQVEDETFVDMSLAQLQSGAGSKFENTTSNSSGTVYSNGAEGYSTSNISVQGNKIVIKFLASQAGKYKLGIRAQSGSNAGKSDVAIADVFDITVNGEAKTASGVIEKASATNTNWKDMTNWTILDDMVGEIDINEGLNVIEFAFKGGTAQTMRFPNIDYFTLTALEEI